MSSILPPTSDTETPARSSRLLLDMALDGNLLADLTQAEALGLLQLTREDDLRRLQSAADALRQRQCGEAVLYETGCSLFLTNLDELHPTVDGYSRRPGEPGAWTLTIDSIDAALETARHRSLSRVYVSGGGYWSDLRIPGLEAPTVLKTYAKTLAHIRERAPQLAIAGFSPDEADFLSIVSDRDVRYILEMFRDLGLQSLGGYGAEILVDAVRRKVSPKKATVRRWFEIAAQAHALGLPVALHLEGGHYETLRQRAQHLLAARQFLQKHPGAFSRFVPHVRSVQLRERLTLPPTPSAGRPRQGDSSNGTSDAKHAAASPMTGAQARTTADQFKLLAVSRLVLGDVLPVQQVFRTPDGEPLAQEGLQWGANHFGATDALAYEAFLSASRQMPDCSEADLTRLITETSHPAEKTTFR